MGEVFAGRYELIDPIAMGGMGAVWLVTDRQDGRLKVAKILRQSDAASLLRFVREQSMRIDHDHVVTPDSWAGMDDRVLFTMPLVRGGSVADLLKRTGPLPVLWAATLLDQTLQALEAVHATGIVHRDVKPANLLLEPTGRDRPHLRLTDFGIAVPLDEPRMTRASMAIGTPGYMAPEQLRGADPDPRQDLYAAGRVAVEMLTGQRPPAESPADLSALAAIPGVEPLLGVVTRMLAEDAAHRPASATALRQELHALWPRLPTDAGDVDVIDQFADAGNRPVTASTAPTLAPAMPPGATRHDPAATRLDRPGTRVLAARTPRGSLLPAVLLFGVGAASFAGAGWLWFG